MKLMQTVIEPGSELESPDIVMTGDSTEQVQMFFDLLANAFIVVVHGTEVARVAYRDGEDPEAFRARIEAARARYATL